MPETQSVPQWRRERRATLLEERIAAGGKQRKIWNQAISASLHTFLVDVRGQVVGLYWPFKGEFDSRPLMRELHGQDARPALPAVVEPRTPLEFRLWWPDAEMVSGVYKIPVPKERNVVLPAIVVVPLVGFDVAGYRLGYGGGYYDRTLAALRPKPFIVGVGYEIAKLETLYPQPHDIPMDVIVTEDRIYDFR